MQGKFGQAIRNPLDVTSYKPIRLTSAVPASNPMTSMVSLLPAIKPNLSQSDRIRIIAADLTDAYGRPIDGNDDGQPVGNYVAILTKQGVTPAAVASAATMAARAVDAVLGRGRPDGVLKSHPLLARTHLNQRNGMNPVLQPSPARADAPQIIFLGGRALG